jgi:hypothetical protein
MLQSSFKSPQYRSGTRDQGTAVGTKRKRDNEGIQRLWFDGERRMYCLGGERIVEERKRLESQGREAKVRAGSGRKNNWLQLVGERG